MEEMEESEMVAFVQGGTLGHIALAKAGDAYAFPVFYAFDGKAFYFHSRHGLKDDFANATEHACLVITRASSPDDWMCVQVFGRVMRVARGKATLRAADALLGVPPPPLSGFVGSGTPARDDAESFMWALVPSRWSGRKSVVAPLG